MCMTPALRTPGQCRFGDVSAELLNPFITCHSTEFNAVIRRDGVPKQSEQKKTPPHNCIHFEPPVQIEKLISVDISLEQVLDLQRAGMHQPTNYPADAKG